MTLLKYGELRKTGFAPTFDLIVYGFSSREAHRIIGSLGYPNLERGEILRRLSKLERKRVMPDGYTANLAKEEVISLVRCLPDVLLDRSAREARIMAKAAPHVTEDDREELNRKATLLMNAVMQNSERMKMLRKTGREWAENPGLLLQREVGIDSC